MIVTTTSGTVYRIDGGSITRHRPDEAEPKTFMLINVGQRHVRFTDGELLYTSSEVVSCSETV